MKKADDLKTKPINNADKQMKKEHEICFVLLQKLQEMLNISQIETETQSKLTR